jgi:hypothetical protein
VGTSRSTGGDMDIEVKGEGHRGQGKKKVVGISRSNGGDIKVKWWGYQGKVVGISRSSGDIKVKGEGLRGQGQKKVLGGACPLQLPLLVITVGRC